MGGKNHRQRSGGINFWRMARRHPHPHGSPSWRRREKAPSPPRGKVGLVNEPVGTKSEEKRQETRPRLPSEENPEPTADFSNGYANDPDCKKLQSGTPCP